MDYTNLRLLSSKESVQVWLCEDECQNLYIQKIYNEKADSIQLNANFKLHSQLQHPGIPCALEIINEEKRTIVIYEYIYGLTLKKYLDLYGCVDEKTAVKWFIELLSILDYIHTALDVPVIHRDIKPSNIVIDGKGDLHLIDFGIARTFKNTHLKDTVVLGSHGFAPPEQYGLNQSDVRSDVFSAAVTIYYSVTGTSLAEPPYQVMPLSTKKGLYSRKFSEILVKAAMLNPSERYPTAASLKKDVEQHYKRITKPVQRFIVATFSIFLLLSILIFMVAFISNKVKYQNLPYPDSPAAFIADSRLKDALISAGVDYYQDGILTEEELRKSEIDLFLNNRGITDLTGMELMVNTVHLELQGNSINDHSPIHSMTALEILYLDDTGLESLEGFENMANLVLLSLGDNPVSDIKPLFALTRLHDLWLKNTLVTDITGIDSLINLRDFSFEGTGLNDITPLTNLKSMNRVDLRSCNIESITPLAGKTSITKLWIDGNKIDFSNPTEKSVLEGLIDLGVVVEFDPQNIPEADISSDVPASDLLDSSTDNFPYNEKQINYNMDINFFMALCKAGYDSNLDEFLTLEEMAAFKSDVDLSLNNIIDIDAARYLVNTETLRLAGNPIKDLAPLSNLYNLHMLLLSDVDLSHYDYFAFPENLETLYLDFCGIKSINQINNLPNLNFLSLTGNGMTTSSLSGLERFKNITSLSINDNAITDITSLVNLNNLSELTLYNNYIDFEDETQQNALNTLLNKGVSVEYEPQRFIPDPSSAPIVFNDDNLRLALIERGADYYPDEKITEDELRAMTGYLDLWECGLTDLFGLRYAENIWGLNIGWNPVVDYSDIFYLTQLESICVNELGQDNPRIENLDGFGSFVNLRTLEASFNQINDVSDILSLSNLEELYLTGNNLGDIGIKDLNLLPNIRRISVADNGVTDISFLSTMTGIEGLEIQDNMITDISVLTGLVNLTDVSMHNNLLSLEPGEDWKVISSLMDRGVYVEYEPQKPAPPDPDSESTGIEDENLKNELIEVGLDYYPDGVLTQAELEYYNEWLWVNNRGIANISGLQYLTNAQGLNLFNNPIADISALSCLTNLTQLALNNTDIDDYDLVNISCL